MDESGHDQGLNCVGVAGVDVDRDREAADRPNAHCRRRVAQRAVAGVVAVGHHGRCTDTDAVRVDESSGEERPAREREVDVRDRVADRDVDAGLRSRRDVARVGREVGVEGLRASREADRVGAVGGGDGVEGPRAVGVLRADADATDRHSRVVVVRDPSGHGAGRDRVGEVEAGDRTGDDRERLRRRCAVSRHGRRVDAVAARGQAVDDVVASRLVVEVGVIRRRGPRVDVDVAVADHPGRWVRVAVEADRDRSESDVGERDAGRAGTAHRDVLAVRRLPVREQGAGGELHVAYRREHVERSTARGDRHRGVDGVSAPLVVAIGLQGHGSGHRSDITADAACHVHERDEHEVRRARGTGGRDRRLCAVLRLAVRPWQAEPREAGRRVDLDRSRRHRDRISAGNSVGVAVGRVTAGLGRGADVLIGTTAVDHVGVDVDRLSRRRPILLADDSRHRSVAEVSEVAGQALARCWAHRKGVRLGVAEANEVVVDLHADRAATGHLEGVRTDTGGEHAGGAVGVAGAVVSRERHVHRTGEAAGVRGDLPGHGGHACVRLDRAQCGVACGHDGHILRGGRRVAGECQRLDVHRQPDRSVDGEGAGSVGGRRVRELRAVDPAVGRRVAVAVLVGDAQRHARKGVAQVVPHDPTDGAVARDHQRTSQRHTRVGRGRGGVPDAVLRVGQAGESGCAQHLQRVAACVHVDRDTEAATAVRRGLVARKRGVAAVVAERHHNCADHWRRVRVEELPGDERPPVVGEVDRRTGTGCDNHTRRHGGCCVPRVAGGVRGDRVAARCEQQRVAAIGRGVGGGDPGAAALDADLDPTETDGRRAVVRHPPVDPRAVVDRHEVVGRALLGAVRVHRVVADVVPAVTGHRER